MTASLAASDFMRTPMLGTAEPDGFKEWHHFVVHANGFRLLINFSLNNQTTAQGGFRLVPRMIVIGHEDRWHGEIARFDEADVDISATLGDLAIGDNRMLVRPEGYRVIVDLPAHGVHGELDFVSVSRPFVVNNQPVGAGRLNWLFVPRLHATGWIRMRGREHRFDGDVAYHDHNWGRFWWGDDFGWEWGTVLPRESSDPWSLVYLRMTDKRRLRYLSQALYVWHHDEPAAIFRHASVQVRTSGVLARPPDCTLPAPMRLLLDGDVPGVPATVEVTAAHSGDIVCARFFPESYARLAQPSELALDGTTVLCESSGTATMTGSINGEGIDFAGTGVFEFLHG